MLTSSEATDTLKNPVYSDDGQLLFGIAQGASDAELRRRSIAEISELDFDGHALGGLAIGEDRPLMFETTAWAALVGRPWWRV